ncbi:DNA translocase FtsK [Cytobacillus sp. S13-E01]|uniref:DNA translocase FtsK n=1 Tax=Cytobacillus sp. S13-E01 TaxID=3031326 RepID=UPI0023D80CA1|nr:DNA translocase FtsK [Cytobacillus sp. S13-E01]MDF0726460.1 DNA translocase FtsK [Cytobacillus sp. S13-E01]
MDWLKKIYTRLKNDNDNDETEDLQLHNNQTNLEHKHIETRVTYQYPKGNFRFPLIPDEQEQKTTVTKNKKSEVSKPVSVVKRSTTKKKEEQQTKKEKSKLPFRPTEVPSPVYGFARPKAVEENNLLDEVVEYELESISLPNLAEKETAATVEIEEEFLYKRETNEKETVIELNPNSRKPEEVIESSDDLIKEDSDEFLDLLHQLKKGPLYTKSEEKEVEIESDTNDMIHEINEKVAPTSIEKNSGVQPINNEGQAEQDELVNTTDETAPKRHYIPYNVMMLKQDRKNLQKRVEATSEEKKANEKIVGQRISFEEIQVDETTNAKEKVKIEELPTKSNGTYHFPDLDLLNIPRVIEGDDEEWLASQSELLDQTLKNFKVRATVVNVTQGPAVTRFEVHPEPGVKVNKITNLSDDIKLSLSAKDIRIEAPIPGKNTIGIEVPNRKSKSVLLREIIQSEEFLTDSSPLTVALGLDISGKPVVTDLSKMPHGLIAGATGSGKSVCINTMLVSLLYKAAPHEVKLLLIDPKMVELAPYNHIPHLVSPVITDVKAATAALKWAVEEMERRYELFAHTGVRDISRYNELVERHSEQSGKLPYLVIIIDELADLMMVAPGDVEEAICRIAQKARACGIHLILATQRPSVDVITGLIKANIPTRIAFSVSSQVDSRTILDTNGADKLLGKGDMLFLENGSSKPTRLQGNFVSDDEIERVVGHVKEELKPTYMFEQEELLKKATINSEEDDLFYEACEFVFDQGGASTSSLQRRFRIGYNRAARLIDIMEEQGIISEGRGSKPREVLITETELENIQETSILPHT